MPESRYGDVLSDADILVGYWDPVTRTFSPMVINDTRGIVNAVKVTTRQDSAQNHGVGTFFLRFAGFYEFTIATDSVVTMLEERCYFDGLIAAGHVKLSTQQNFLDEY